MLAMILENLWVRNTLRGVVIALASGFAAIGNAGNIYDAATGSLMVPVIAIEGGTSYSSVFTLVSEEPLVWGSDTFNEVVADARTAASYNAESGTLLVPEVKVLGNLYTLEFSISTDCGFAVCISPLVESVQDNGRDGANVFTTALSSNSTFSCSSCHAMSETNGFAVDGIRRPGHTLENASRRSSYKDGQLDSFLDAVNTCVVEWMNGSALVETDQDWVNLLNWFEDQATEDVGDLVDIQIVPPPADLSGGELAAGQELFNTRCIVCHGLNGEGTELAPQITERGLTEEYIAERTRRSGLVDSPTYAGLTGGIMPFWGDDRLSDDELVDIVAFVAAGEAEVLQMGGDDPPDPGATGCTSEHPNVGQRATFVNGFHDISGTAVIVDDCTIEIQDFTFDGGGINVQVYLGIGGFFLESDGGFSSSDDLVGIAFNGGILRVTLPEGRTLDDFDSISIWCVPVGVSFATAVFS